MIDYTAIKNFKFFKKLTDLPFVNTIILYGSRARGDQQERSDIDLAIDCPYAQEMDWVAILDIIEEADTLLKIDCVRFDKLSDNNPLKQAIQRDGIYLYKKRNRE
jgi:uncharacterized protein